MKIIKKGPLKPSITDGYLFIAVEGEEPGELNSLDAKKLAWNDRFNHGFGNAGIEVWRAPFPLDLPKDAKEGDKPKYAIIYRLVPGI